MNQIEVLVKEKSSGDQRTMTYKSFLDLQDRFDLIGQCDEKGDLIPGDPNLNPRHQKVAVNDVAVHVGDPGMTMEEKLARRDELLKKYATPPKDVVTDHPVFEMTEEPKEEPTANEPEQPKQRKKPGPKPKQSA